MHKRDRSSSSNQHRRKKRSKSRSRDRHRYKSKKDGRRSSQRSRSRQHKYKSQKNDETLKEELDQRIRLAMRAGTFQKDKELQFAISHLPQDHLNILYEQAMRPSQINEPILVRELFISGLVEMTELVIKDLVQGYGQIEGVEICKNFAFVKFFRVEDASNACADYHNINMRLHSTQNPNFKMFFADHLKRWNVVSNNPEYQVRDHLIPVVYASIRNDPKIVNQEYLKGVFGRYGPVRTLVVKQNQSPGPKVYVLVEYECLEHALRAREKLATLKQKLGDRRGQVTILLDTNKVTKAYPNVGNQLRYQKQNVKRFQQQMSSSIPQTYNSMNIEAAHFEPDPTLYKMLVQIAESHQEEVDWSGFFTRNKKFRVGVDLRLLTKVHLDLQFVLNISHRGDIEDGLSRPNPYAIGKFRATDNMNLAPFSEYIRYFQEKGRAGIIQTQIYLIFLIPPGVNFKHSYEIANNQLLALFFKK